MKEHIPQIIEALSPVLLAIIGWVGVQVAAFIRARTKNEVVSGVLIRLDDAVIVAVKESLQVYVDAIKEASQDGRLTDDEKARAKELAIASVKSHIGVKGLKEIVTVLGLDAGMLDKFIGSRIEAAVSDTKMVAVNP